MVKQHIVFLTGAGISVEPTSRNLLARGWIFFKATERRLFCNGVTIPQEKRLYMPDC